MSTKDNGGPAFPVAEWDSESFRYINTGMTLRAYAAIKLKVPDSGIDWLDEMIQKSLRDDFAAKAIQGFCAHISGALKKPGETAPQANARLAYEQWERVRQIWSDEV